MSAQNSDKRLLLILSGVMLVLIAAVSIFAPRKGEDDPTPTSTNNGPAGLKGAYLTLERTGRKVSRWDRPLAELNGSLSDEQAARTTLVLAEPAYDGMERKALAAVLNRFLQRGGRVLATGEAGAILLGGDMKAPAFLQSGLCESVPEGPGALAAAGSVEMTDRGAWSSDAPQYRVQQRCGTDAVVVSFAVGSGEAVWWTSSTPIENAELRHDANLRLMLASLGDGREILFDDALHGAPRSLWDAAKGLPLTWLSLQCGLAFGLLILSFSRRRGPLRMPVSLPRSSPVEFAESMGDLYERGGATSAAVAAARRRLLRVLAREAGLAASTLEQSPHAIADALAERVAGDWSALAGHLQAAQDATLSHLSNRSALALVRALSDDAAEVRKRIASPKTNTTNPLPALAAN